MRSVLRRLFGRHARVSPVQEFALGLDGGMAAAHWVRITEPRSGLDRRLMHAWPTGLLLWAPPVGGARVAYITGDDRLLSWVDSNTIGWLSPHASSMPAIEALHCLQHNKVVLAVSS